MPKVGRLSRLDHKSLCSMFLVSLFVWAGVVATAQVDENRSLLAIKCPQCPKNRRFPSNDHSEHLPRCSSSLRNTKMSCRKGAASVFEAFPETQCTTYSCDGAVRPTSSHLRYRPAGPGQQIFRPADGDSCLLQSRAKVVILAKHHCKR